MIVKAMKANTKTGALAVAWEHEGFSGTAVVSSAGLHSLTVVAGASPEPSVPTLNRMAAAPLPESVMTARQLHRLPLGELLNFARSVRRHPAQTDDQPLQFKNYRDHMAHVRWAQAAAIYAEAVANSQPPFPAIMDQFGITRRMADNYIARARTAGYLTPGVKGRAGGEVTQLGQRVAEMPLEDLQGGLDQSTERIRHLLGELRSRSGEGRGEK